MNKEIKNGMNNVEEIFKNFVCENFEGVQLEIKEHEIIKPAIFNIWIEAKRSISNSEALDLIKKLNNSHFCLNEEVDKFVHEIITFNKIKIAALPKNYLSNFIRDLKLAINEKDFFISLNETHHL